jgi:hypothetical protein
MVVKARKGGPVHKRTCREFLEYWGPKLREIEREAELDYSFKLDAITITDMTIPSALRTGILFTRKEVEEHADHRITGAGKFQDRVTAFMAAGRPKN